MRAHLRAIAERVLPPAAVQVLFLLSHPRWGCEVAADLWKTWRETRFIRRDVGLGTVKGPVVALLLLGDSIYETKLLLALSIGLRLHGWRAVVVTKSTRLSMAAMYGRAFGVRRIVRFDALALDSEQEQR